ncbi:hypothetical protein A33K_15503 [Burkholderia humptydooensis MSMB43]|uniref:Uncharacterized protein n=1 Tax=Burkholderia humptydooensis MSMB43 TaxID=441157 RepID=A0ABN0G5F7_9BURK|nr:hypothetical protein A33K_15503 [Burkholderia humptydooensis MSMB43]
MAEGSHLRSVSSVGCAVGRPAPAGVAPGMARSRGARPGCVSRRILKRFVRGCRASGAAQARRRFDTGARIAARSARIDRIGRNLRGATT